MVGHVPDTRCTPVRVCVYVRNVRARVRARSTWWGCVSKSIDVVSQRWQLSIYDELLTTTVCVVPVRASRQRLPIVYN